MYLNKLTIIPKQHRKINTVILQNVLLASQKHQLISSQTLFTKVGKININYEVSGVQGKIALCLPGSMGCAETDFLPQINSLGNSKLQVLFWDPPGYGKSIPPSRHFSNNFFKDDAKIALELMKTLGHNKFSLLGWSDGGITSLIMAALYPQNIEKMVIWGANSYIHEDDLKLYNAVRDIEKWSERMRKPMEKIYGKEYFEDTWHAWVDAMIAIHKNNAGNICDDLLHQIVCPTLIIHGEKDAMVDENHAQNLHKKIKNSQLIIWKDGKHNLHLKYAKEFNNIVQKFILE